MLTKENINVIRLGLHSGGNVEEGFLAGPYHPAFREICESKIYYDNIVSQLEKEGITRGDVEITVGAPFVSMAVGQRKSNIARLNEKGFRVKIVQNKEYEKYKVTVRG